MAMNELTRGKLDMNERRMDKPDVKETPLNRPAMEEISVDDALHVQSCQRWSDAGSELAQPATAAQVGPELNTSYRSQAILHTLTEYITGLHAELDLKRQLLDPRNYDKAFHDSALRFILYLLPFAVLPPVLVIHDRYIWILGPLSTLALLCLFRFLGNSQEGPKKIPETDRLQNFESLMVDTLRHRQLEILCRYGDYLAERLGTLRQHINKNNPENEHKMSERWTETSATLRQEERQEHAPYHKLIGVAAQDLNWKQDTTIFMVHEYAKRNSLMHAELFDLVDRQDWSIIGQRCKEDIEKLCELFINSDSNSKAAIENWVQIIGDFRGRWVYQSEDGSAWRARPIIQDAIVAGVVDRSSLNKLAMLPNDAASTDRDKAISKIKKEKEMSEKQSKKAQKEADAALREENRLLRAEMEKLQISLKLNGVSADVLADFKAEVERDDELKKENRRCQNKMKQFGAKIRELEDQCEADKFLERAFGKKCKDLGVDEKTIKDIRDTSREESRLVSEKKRQRLLGKQKVDLGEKDSNIEEKNKNAGEKNIDIEERHTDDSADSAAIEQLSNNGEHSV